MDEEDKKKLYNTRKGHRSHLTKLFTRGRDAVSQEQSVQEKEICDFIAESEDYLSERKIDLSVLEHSVQALTINVPSNRDFTTRPKRLTLEKLKLPTFSGNLLEWKSFWDLFCATVDKQSDLSGIEKFSHLITHLTGEAKECLEGLPLTDVNYFVAKKLLCDRFGQAHKIAEVYMTSLLSLPAPRYDLKSLRSFYDKLEKYIRSLDSIGKPTSNYGAMLVPVLRTKLPYEVNLSISKEHGNKDWDLDSLRTAIKNEVLTLEACNTLSCSNSTQAKSSTVTSLISTVDRVNYNRPVKQQLHRPNNSNRGKCAYCYSSNHYANQCEIITDPEIRFSMIRNANLCYSCLGKHRSRDCGSQQRCKSCGGKHHSSLCSASFFRRSQPKGVRAHLVSCERSVDGTAPTPQLVPAARNPTPQQQSTMSLINESNSYAKSETSIENVNISVAVNTVQTIPVHLKTAVGRVTGPEEHTFANILFDDGSQRSFVTEELANLLKLQIIKNADLNLCTFGATSTTNRKVDIVEINIICTDGSTLKVEAIVVPAITKPLLVPSDIETINEFKGLQFAQPIHYASDHIDISVLIGSDYYYNFIETEGTIRSSDGPVAVPTKLGYVITGPRKNGNSSNVSMLHVVSEPDSYNLGRFWSLDILGIAPPVDETSNFLEEYLNSSISKEGGIYQAKLPWRVGYGPLPSNYSVAYGRTRSLARRLFQSSLLESYDGIIKYQLERDFIEKVAYPDPIDDLGKIHYIPHHAVFRESSTTPIRIVFDCSCRSSKNSLSLNDCLESGPCLLNELTSILIRFRLFDCAVTTDIEKAFLHVGLDKSDRDSTLFLWLSDSKDTESTFEVYRFKRVLFGAKCSPFMLNSTIIYHLRNNFKGKFTNNLLRDIYVDNISTSVNSVSDVIQFYKEARSLKENANFNFRCWASNSSQLRELAKHDGVLEPSRIVKNLGLMWDTDRDLIAYPKHAVIDESPITKRVILKRTAKIYDPLGFLTPVTLPSKLLLQDLWKQSYGWDDLLPKDICSQWFSINENLCRALDMTFQRKYFSDPNLRTTDLELHIFGDSSTRAYGAVAYLKSGSQSSLIMSKSRVAPVKELTIPKLELMAATVAARLSDHIQRSINPTIGSNSPIKSFHWTDSQIVLGWLNSGKKQTQFVNNRVSEIRKLTSLNSWFYCPGNVNPADLLTRGVHYNELTADLWLKGPSWLTNGSPLPEQPSTISINYVVAQNSDPIRKKESSIFTFQLGEVIDYSQFTSYSELVNVMALALRFIHNLKSIKEDRNHRPLSSSEIVNAEKLIIKYFQSALCAEIIQDLTSGTKRKKLSVVNQLQLYIDDEGIIRCKGRLQNADMSFDSKHPIFVPKSCMLSSLIINDAHLQVMHFGVSATVCKIRENFWIPQIRQAVKSQVRKCVTCRKVSGKPFTLPDPPPLPGYRVSRYPPFYYCGLDYCGPFVLNNGSNCYIALFTCTVTRAVHCEVVVSNSTDEFIRCFRRFTARRSVPRMLISDNASTFIGANSELKKIFEALSSTNFLSKRRIDWHFITKRSPWHGGFYERLIGLTKSALKKCLGRAKVTLDEFSTLITEIECTINDRPLVRETSDINDINVLTPSHLVCGRKINSLPHPEFDINDPDYSNLSESELQNRYKFLVTLQDKFWDKWHKEYLVNLRESHKSVGDNYQNIKPGMLVLIHDAHVPRLRWKLAIIIKILRGEDDLIRSVELKTANGFTNRPISKLVYLEL
ncbi:uncharacterized protein LOC141911530 [Tubulanus polymorphus]|uniref:uncharacterized protein LOC141911530 n=1 Tax=Tubulanus polymorphus TaxID=672921 RepID=UPI003DA41FA8